MANFKTHLGVAAIASGGLSTLCLGAGLATPQQVVVLTILGSAGGILPDIDLDHSSPTKIMFTALALLVAFFALFSKSATYSLLELWLLWGACYFCIRYMAWRIFSDLTSHRGIYHSLVAALFFYFLTTTLAYYLFDWNPVAAWLAGFLVFFGYMVHLALDEIYSVDFSDKRLKKSFGTALKLIDPRHLKNSVLMSFAAVLVFFMTPDFSYFWDVLSDGNTWGTLASRLLPQGSWFEF